MTIPDQAMSLRELLDAHSRGFAIPGNLQPIYEQMEFATSGIDVRSLDLIDLQNYRMKVNAEIGELTRQYQVEQKLTAQQAAEKVKAEQEKQYQEWKKRFEKEQSGKD